MLVAPREAKNPFDLIRNVTETSRLAAIAIDCQLVATQGLSQEIGNDTTVAHLQARSIRVKDAHQVSIYILVTVIGHYKRLRETLGLVIDRARTYGIDIPPIFLGLRMLVRISITL